MPDGARFLLMISSLGNGNNMKNTKTIKTVLFAGLIAAMILPFSGMDFAEARTADDKIPDNKLLDRGEDWKNKYSSQTDFEKSEKAIRSYVSDNHPDNKWNKDTKKNQIVIYNFDTIADARNAGLNALLIDVQNQKDNGTYNPTEAEKKFHEWADGQQVGEVTQPNVNKGQIKKVIEAYNSNANYGNVPTELINSDVDFWTNVAADKLCDLLEDCDTSGEQPSEECFGQCAYATWWSTYHVLSGWVDTYDCETGNCYYSDSDDGTGSLSILMSPGTNNHAKDDTIDYFVKDKSYVSGYDVYHNFSGLATIGSASDSFSENGTNEITHSDSLTVGSCGSQHCGTYSLSASAQGAYFET